MSVDLSRIGEVSTILGVLGKSLECQSCSFIIREPKLSLKCEHVACAVCFVNMVCPICQSTNSEKELVAEQRLKETATTYKKLREVLKTLEDTENIPQKSNINSSPLDPSQKTAGLSNTTQSVSTPSSTALSNKLNKKNRLGETPLHVACKKDKIDRVRELLLQGASPNTQDNAGWSPLHEVAQTGNVEITTLLIEHGADVNVAAQCGTTPLHDAVATGHPKVIEVLMKNGANPDLKNEEGKSSIDLAEYNDIIKQTLSTCPRGNKPVSPAKAEPLKPPIRMMSSSLKGQDLEVYTKCVEVLEAQSVSKFDDAVTHLVVRTDETGNTQRTLKYLQCVAAGKWIVSMDWAAGCVAKKSPLDEREFEAKGSRQFPGLMAPRKARENAETDGIRLLSGFGVYFTPADRPIVPSTEDLTEMARSAGATILRKPPKASDNVADGNPSPHVRFGSIFKKHQNLVVSLEMSKLKGGVLHVTRDWLIDAISKFELIEPLE